MMDRPSPAQAAPPSAPKPIALSLRAVEPTVRALLVYAGVMAWFAVPVLTVRSLTPGSTLLPWIAGATASLSLVALLWTFRASAASHFASVSNAISTIPERTWIAVCLATGIVIRLAWIAAFPGSPASDGATYVGLARKLIAGEPYLAGGTLAYWPPGYPLFLVPWLALIPVERVAIVTANLLLFVAGALGVRSLARRVSDEAPRG